MEQRQQIMKPNVTNPAKPTAPKDRVNQAIAFQKPDRTPRDFAAVPEVWAMLGAHFGTPDRHQILKRLDVDCRIVSYDSFLRPPTVAPDTVDVEASRERSSTGGMWRRIEPDGSNRDIWGAHRARVANAFGALDQLVSFPLASAETLDDLRRYPWPQPEWWDFTGLRRVIGALNDEAIYSIRYRAGSVFETAWSLYGLDRFLLELAANPSLPVYIMERIAEVHLANLGVVMETAGDLIDIVYFYDDLASQNGLLLSPELYEAHIQPFHQKLIDLAARYRKPVMMHCCGAVYPLIPRLIRMGLRVLNPIQPSARHMEPGRLAAEFGGRIAFHGGIDVQQFLPGASPQEVRERVAAVSSVLGQNGGYILAGSHHLQADTPVENILAMFGA
jgi:uroporphyrinogen decarboxylase